VTAVVSSVAAYTVVAVLLGACGSHLSRPAALRHALAAHRLLPAPALVAAAVVAAEGGLAGAGAAALVAGARGPLAVTLAGGAVLLALFGCYGWYVLSTGRGGPCGCSRVELPMTGWVVSRALALAGLALVGSLLSGSVLPPGRPSGPLTIVLLAAATFGCLLWQLPAAMYDPAAAAPAEQGGPG
jgi:hypothetical protein